MTAELFANAYSTTLSGSIGAGDSTIQVNDSPPPALTGAGQFRAVIEQEYLIVTAVGGSGSQTWSVQRGQEGSAAAAHSDGTAVTHIVTAGSLSTFLPSSPSHSFVVQPTADVTPLVLQASAGQTSNVFSVRNSSGQPLLAVDPNGSLDTWWRGANPLHHLGNIAAAGSVAAAHYLYGSNGAGRNNLAWVMGVDTAADVPYRDYFLARANHDGSVADFFYLSYDNGNGAIAAGMGWVPPPTNFALSISGADADPTQGGLAIRMSTKTTTGQPLAFIDSSSGQSRLWLDSSGWWHTDGSVQNGFQVKAANTASPQRSLILADNAGRYHYGFQHGSGGDISFHYFNGGTDLFTAFGSQLTIKASRLGFFGGNTVAKPTVTGQKGGSQALASLISALSSLGLITDNSSG
jgi:hypothetical protein